MLADTVICTTPVIHTHAVPVVSRRSPRVPCSRDLMSPATSAATRNRVSSPIGTCGCVRESGTARPLRAATAPNQHQTAQIQPRLRHREGVYISTHAPFQQRHPPYLKLCGHNVDDALAGVLGDTVLNESACGYSQSFGPEGGGPKPWNEPETSTSNTALVADWYIKPGTTACEPQFKPWYIHSMRDTHSTPLYKRRNANRAPRNVHFNAPIHLSLEV